MARLTNQERKFVVWSVAIMVVLFAMATLATWCPAQDKAVPKLSDAQRAEIALLQRDAAKVVAQMAGPLAQLQTAYQQIQDKLRAAEDPVNAALKKAEVAGYRLDPETLEYRVVPKKEAEAKELVK